MDDQKQHSHPEEQKAGQKMRGQNLYETRYNTHTLKNTERRANVKA